MRGLVDVMHPILEQMQWDTEILEAELVGEPKFAETEEILVEVFGEVAANELFAAVVEGADAVCTGVVAEGGALGGALVKCGREDGVLWDREDVRVDQPGDSSSAHAPRPTSCPIARRRL